MSTAKVPVSTGSMMVWPLATIEDGATLREAAAEMAAEEVGALIVYVGGRPLGLLTERDLAGALASGADPDTDVVADTMTTDVVSVDSDDSMRQAAEQMLQVGTRHLPVTHDGEIVGMVSIRDLLGALIAT